MRRDDRILETRTGAAGGIGAVLMALLGGLARQADDVGRGLLHSVDDIGRGAGRGAMHQVDDLGRIGVGTGDDVFCGADDILRTGRAFGSSGDEAVTYRPYAGSSEIPDDMAVVNPVLREVATRSIQHAIAREQETVE